eukprot:3164191-Pyramimonas_sp.AAC.1
MTEHFPRQENSIIDYEQMREQQMQLIRERAELRTRLHYTCSKSFEGDGSSEFDRIEQQLKTITRRMQELQHQQQRGRMSRL